MGKMSQIFINSLFSIFLISSFSYALNPNLILSKGPGKIFTSSGNTTLLNDGKFTTSGGWTISANSWIAINVGKGPSKVFLCWDSPMEIWSDSLAAPWVGNSGAFKTVNMPFEYQILTSDSSTTGLDGQWTEAITIKNNVVAGRGHLIDFAGKNWIKMNITKSSTPGQLDEIGVFDASNGLEDSWIFIGTSISQMAFRSNVPTSFFDLISTKTNSLFTPSIIRGGIGYIRSGDIAKDIVKYLANAGNMHFWAIEMGTNDAWGGTNANVASYKANMQLIIDSCKAHHISPIIARMIATNPNKTTEGKWQIHPDYLTAIDDLTSKNKLFPGPDFYNFFLQNPSQLNSDGIHPSAIGAASIQRLWAEKMDSVVYKATRVKPSSTSLSVQKNFSVSCQNKRLVLRTKVPGNASFFSISGEMLEKIELAKAGAYTLNNTPGIYLIKFKSAQGVVTKPIVIH